MSQFTERPGLALPAACQCLRAAVALAVALASPAAAAQTGESRPPVHQVGIEASQLFKLLEEEEEPGAYTIAYRLSPSPRGALRLGVSYRQVTGESSVLGLGVRVGADRVFVNERRWHFYAGLDAVSFYESFRQGENRDIEVGLSPLLGFQFRIGRRFSLSTEPRLLLLFHHRHEESFDRTESDGWFEAGLSGIGQLQVAFHF